MSFVVTMAANHGSPQSTVVFLNGGVILGKAMTDSAGIATLNIPLPGNGTHDFRASFSGDSQFAPSVTPEAQELWPDSGPNFSVAVNPVIIKFNGERAEGEVSVTAASALRIQFNSLVSPDFLPVTPAILNHHRCPRAAFRILPFVLPPSVGNALPDNSASKKRSFNSLLRGLAFSRGPSGRHLCPASPTHTRTPGSPVLHRFGRTLGMWRQRVAGGKGRSSHHSGYSRERPITLGSLDSVHTHGPKIAVPHSAPSVNAVGIRADHNFGETQLAERVPGSLIQSPGCTGPWHVFPVISPVISPVTSLLSPCYDFRPETTYSSD